MLKCVSCMYMCVSIGSLWHSLTNRTTKAVIYRQAVTVEVSGHQMPLKSHKAWWRGGEGGVPSMSSGSLLTSSWRLLCFYETRQCSPHSAHSCLRLKVSFSLLTIIFFLLSVTSFAPLMCPFNLAPSLIISFSFHLHAILWDSWTFNLSFIFTLFFFHAKTFSSHCHCDRRWSDFLEFF